MPNIGSDFEGKDCGLFFFRSVAFNATRKLDFYGLGRRGSATILIRLKLQNPFLRRPLPRF